MKPKILARAVDSFQRQGLMGHLGAQLIEASGGRCVVEAKLTSALTQQMGYFHGGVAASLADTAAGHAALTLVPEGFSVLTTEFKVNFLRPADGDRLRAEAVVVQAGRTLMVTRADVFILRGADARQCGMFLGTMFVVREDQRG